MWPKYEYFSKEFLERDYDVSEDVIIYSVVNSLTELNTVNQVRLTVEGQILDVYSEYSSMASTLERNYDIINNSKNGKVSN